MTRANHRVPAKSTLRQRKRLGLSSIILIRGIWVNSEKTRISRLSSCTLTTHLTRTRSKKKRESCSKRSCLLSKPHWSDSISRKLMTEKKKDVEKFTISSTSSAAANSKQVTCFSSKKRQISSSHRRRATRMKLCAKRRWLSSRSIEATMPPL